MAQRTRKEFAEYLKMDVKSLADKIRYQEKKLGKSFGQDFTDTKIYSEQEQIEICELLEIPVFHVEVHTKVEHDFMSEKQRETLKENFEQMNELLDLIEDVNFVRLDKNFADRLKAKLGEDFKSWYVSKTGKDQFDDYLWDFIKIKDIAEYYFEKEKMS